MKVWTTTKYGEKKKQKLNFFRSSLEHWKSWKTQCDVTIGKTMGIQWRQKFLATNRCSNNNNNSGSKLQLVYVLCFLHHSVKIPSAGSLHKNLNTNLLCSDKPKTKKSLATFYCCCL